MVFGTMEQTSDAAGVHTLDLAGYVHTQELAGLSQQMW
jgi:hypothetical protein